MISSSSSILFTFIIIIIISLLISNNSNNNNNRVCAQCDWELDPPSSNFNQSFIYLPDANNQFLSSTHTLEQISQNCNGQTLTIKFSGEVSHPIIITKKLPSTVTLRLLEVNFNRYINFPLDGTQYMPDTWVFQNNETSLIVVEDAVSMPIIIEKCTYNFNGNSNNNQQETVWLVSHFLYAPDYQGSSIRLIDNQYSVKNAKSADVYKAFERRGELRRKFSYFLLRWAYIQTVSTAETGVQNVLIENNNIDITMNLETIDYVGKVWEQTSLVTVVGSNVGSEGKNSQYLYSHYLDALVQTNNIKLQYNKIPALVTANRTFADWDQHSRFRVSLVNVYGRDSKIVATVQRNTFSFSGDQVNSVFFIAVNCTTFWYPLFPFSPVYQQFKTSFQDETIPGSELYVFDNSGSVVITGYSLRNIIYFSTAQFFGQVTLPFYDFADEFMDMRKQPIISTMSYMKTAHVARNSWTVDLNCYTLITVPKNDWSKEPNPQRPKLKNYTDSELYFNKRQNCEAIFAGTVVWDMRPGMSDAFEATYDTLAPVSMRSSIRFNYQIDSYIVEGNTFSAKIINQVGAGSYEPRLSVRMYLASTEPSCYRFGTYKVHNNTVVQNSMQMMFGFITGVYIGGVPNPTLTGDQVTLRGGSNGFFTKLASFNEFIVSENRFLKIEVKGLRGTFFCVEFETGANGLEINNMMNVSSNFIDIGSRIGSGGGGVGIDVNSSEARATVLIVQNDIFPTHKTLLLENNVMKGVVKANSAGLSYISLLVTPSVLRSGIPEIKNGNVSMQNDELLRICGNVLDFDYGSPGPIWFNGLTSIDFLVAKKKMIVADNVLIGRLLTLLFRLPLEGGMIVQFGPGISSPRQFVIRCGGLFVENDDLIVRNNSVILSGEVAPFFFSLSAGILPLLTKRANPSLVTGILSVKNLLKARRINCHQNKLHLDLNIADGTPPAAGKNPAETPTVFTSIFNTELTTQMEVTDSFSISLSNVSVIVSKGAGLNSFDSRNIRATLFAAYPLPGSLRVVNPASSIRNELTISDSSVRVSSGVASVMSLCREGPASDLPFEDMMATFLTATSDIPRLTKIIDEVLDSTTPMICSTDKVKFDANFWPVNNVPFAVKTLRMERVNTQKLTADEIQKEFRTEKDKRDVLSSKIGSVFDEGNADGVIMNLPSKAFGEFNNVPSPSIYISNSFAESFAIIPVEEEENNDNNNNNRNDLVVPRVDSSGARYDVFCSHFDVIEAREKVCHNVPRCNMPSCVPTKTISQTPFSRTVSLRPLCDPEIGLTFLNEKPLEQNDFQFLDARKLATGRPFFVRFQLMADWDEYQFSYFSSTIHLFGKDNSNRNPLSLLELISIKIINGASNNNNEEEPISFRIINAERSGLLTIDAELVITSSFSEYTTEPWLYLCLNDVDRESQNVVFACDVPKSGFPSRICSTKPLVFPRRWSGIDAAAVEAVSGLASAGAVGAPILLSAVASGRPASLASAIALQRQSYVMSMLDCSKSQYSSLSFLESPFGMKIGDENGMYLRGAALGNTLILFIVGALGLAFTAYRSQNVRNAQFAADVKEQNANRNNLNFHRNRFSQLKSNNLQRHLLDNNNNQRRGSPTIHLGSEKTKTRRGNMTAKSFGGLSPEEAKNVPLLHPKFQAESSFPNRVFLFLVVLIQGTVMSGIALIFVQSQSTDIILGLLALLIPFGLSGYICFAMFPKSRFSNSVLAREIPPTPFRPKSFSCFSVIKAFWSYLIEETIAWRSKSRLIHQQQEEAEGKQKGKKNSKGQKKFFVPYFVERFGEAFCPTIPTYYWFVMLHDVGFSIILAILGATTPSPNTAACYANQVVAALIVGLSFILCSLFPLFSRVENFFLVSASFGTVTSLCLILAASYSTVRDTKQSLIVAADGIDATVNILCIIKLILDLTVFADGFFPSSSRKNWVRKFLEKRFPKMFKPVKNSNRSHHQKNSRLFDSDEEEAMKDLSPQEMIQKIQQRKQQKLEEERKVRAQFRTRSLVTMINDDDGEPLDEGEEIDINDIEDDSLAINARDFFAAPRRSSTHHSHRHDARNNRKDRKSSSARRYQDYDDDENLLHQNNRKPSTAVELSNFLRHSVGSFRVGGQDSTKNSNGGNNSNERRDSREYGRSSGSNNNRTRSDRNNNRHSSSGNRRRDSSSSAPAASPNGSFKVVKSADGKTSIVPQSYKRYSLL